jgi:TATA-box binding protein (TBP) (component of TFIID and TFIIIB)
MDDTDKFLDELETEFQATAFDETENLSDFEYVQSKIALEQKIKIKGGGKQYMHCTNEFKIDDLPPCIIDNVVCTYNIGVTLQLKQIALRLRHLIQCKFNPSKFAAMGVIFESAGIRKGTALFFSTGNVVLTGPKSAEFARLAAHALNYFLNVHLNICASMINFQIRNIVSHFTLPFKIDLKKLEDSVGGRATFAPENIHCCRIRSELVWAQVCLVFFSGAVVITGAKRKSDIIALYEKNARICIEHKSNGQYTKEDCKKMNNDNDSQKVMEMNSKLNRINEGRHLAGKTSRHELRNIIEQIEGSSNTVKKDLLLEG